MADDKRYKAALARLQRAAVRTREQTSNGDLVEVSREDLEEVVGSTAILESLDVRGGRFTADLSIGERLGLAMCEAMREALDAESAENYIEMDIRATTGESYTVAFARTRGRTPHALRRHAEGKLRAVKQVLTDYDGRIPERDAEWLATRIREALDG